MSYYEDRIMALEARIEEMSRDNRMKAIPVERQIIDRIAELIKENARLKADAQLVVKHLGEACADNLSLKAEVDLWKLRSDNWQKLVQLTKAEVERLTADNRQLTKAFEIAEGIIKRMGKAAENAAKEGKQS